jgi:hypothetical protein
MPEVIVPNTTWGSIPNPISSSAPVVDCSTYDPTFQFLNDDTSKMETGLGWASFFNSTGVVTNTSVRAHSGTKSNRMDTIAGGQYNSAIIHPGNSPDLVPLVVGRKYEIRGWVWVPTGSPRFALAPWFVGVWEPIVISSHNDQWEELVSQYIVDTERGIGVFNYDTAVLNQSCWFDDVILREVNSRNRVGYTPVPFPATVWS